jgi:pimeloyl-ACP methyl ester carboxylesterase
MSRPQSLGLDPGVRRSDLETERGTFATWLCDPHETSLPRGHVLLIPGFTGSKEDFAPLLPLLAESGWSGATYDQRGQFESPGGPDDDYSLRGFADDAVAVSAALFGVDERVHLVGHSFGGLVAGTAAIEHPEIWASLTLVCSGPGAIEGERGKAALTVADLIKREGLEAAWEAKQRDEEERGIEPAEGDVAEFVHRRFLSNSPESLAAISRHLGTAPDRTPELTDLTIPTSMLRGENDDAWPHGVQDALAKALGTKVVLIKDASDSPAVEQPESTRDALARILLAS